MSRLVVQGLEVDLGGRAALRGAGFEARAGELVGLLGPNGAGKTTLLRALCRLVPIRAGEMVWDGRRIDRMGERERATTLAYLPQGQAVHWPLAVRRLVELGRLPRLGPLAKPGPADTAAVDAAMAAAGVTDLADRPATGLSGGERARVLLARALAVEAPVLLADEPVAALDPRHALAVMDLLERIASEGRLVVAVMHDLDLAERFCDRIVLLQDGRTAAEGSPQAVLTPERLQAVYGLEGEPPPRRPPHQVGGIRALTMVANEAARFDGSTRPVFETA